VSKPVDESKSSYKGVKRGYAKVSRLSISQGKHSTTQAVAKEKVSIA
jgi:hypothetical protein